MKKYKRNCPKCGKKLFYTRKSTYDKMEEKKSLCMTCSKRIFDLSNHKESDLYYKMCPKCNIDKIYYTTEKGLKYAIKHNTICKKCKSLQKENIEYRRNCPKCGKELFTKNKFWNKTAVEENRICGSCVMKGRIFTEEWKNNLKTNHADFSGIKNPFYKKHHSDFVREKMSNISEEKRKHLRKKFHEFLVSKKSSPTFNKRACKYLDKLNEEKGWNLQHALNGGEYVINGFWIDGYDKERNIIVEYDERKHYRANGNLRQKDIKRQEEIIKTLHCKFYRYNEALDKFYEVILNEEDSKS
jgi:hypothetical protein